MKEYSFPKEERIIKKRQFEEIFKNAKKYISPYFIIYYLSKEQKRAGFIVKKTIGNAVLRNRIKRVLREVYRLNKKGIEKNIEIIIVAKREIIGKEYKEVEKAFQKWIEYVK